MGGSDAEGVHLGKDARVSFIDLRREAHPEVNHSGPVARVHEVWGAHRVHFSRLGRSDLLPQNNRRGFLRCIKEIK